MQEDKDAQIRTAMAGLRESVPFIDDLWQRASTVRKRVAMLRAKELVPDSGTLHQRLTAFYVGALEGVVRKHMPISLTPPQIGELTFALAMYTARKDAVIDSDAAWVTMATEFQQVLGQPAIARFAQLGVSYSMADGARVESIWQRLESDFPQDAGA